MWSDNGWAWFLFRQQYLWPAGRWDCGWKISAYPHSRIHSLEKNQARMDFLEQSMDYKLGDNMWDVNDQRNLLLGRNAVGQIGDGNPGATANSSPVKLLAAKEWQDLEVGEGHVCAITSSNDAYCWGWNVNGQTGIGTMIDQSTPSLVLNDIKWTNIILGKSSSCGIATGGKAYCWGLNNNGQAGNGVTSPSQTTPAAVLGNTKWFDVEPGFGMACGINEFNQTYCWGSGNLGAGNTTSSLIPWRVSEPLAQP